MPICINMLKNLNFNIYSSSINKKYSKNINLFIVNFVILFEVTVSLIHALNLLLKVNNVRFLYKFQMYDIRYIRHVHVLQKESAYIAQILLIL